MSDDRFLPDSTVFNPAKPKPKDDDSWEQAISPEDKMFAAMKSGRLDEETLRAMKILREYFPEPYERALKRFREGKSDHWAMKLMRDYFPDAYERAKERAGK